MKSHKQIKCPVCKGKGMYYNYRTGDSEVCNNCIGTGTISKPEEVKPRKIEKLSHKDCWKFLDSLENREDYGSPVTNLEWEAYKEHKLSEIIDFLNNLDK